MSAPLSATVTLAQRLIKRQSLTPQDEGCQDLLFSYLKPLRFRTEVFYEAGTVNLLALHGSGAPFTLFLGHSDVVPPGEAANWTHPPFEGIIAPDESNIPMLWGRGAADMKGSDAAMTIALRDFVTAHPDHAGTVGLLITSNEEGDGIGGVKYVASKLRALNLVPDFCLVGEPSCGAQFGDTIKVGRRGSLTANITVHGVQGHVAYPERLINPIHQMASLIAALQEPLDNGNEVFPPTSFECTNLHAGTGAENVVPGTCTLMCNWRFNNLQTKDSIDAQVKQILQRLNLKAEVKYTLNGEPFLCPQGELCTKLQEAILEVCGSNATLSTAGGTSDGRFIAPLGTQVLEFGPRSATIHQVNERVAVDDLDKLMQIYLLLLEKLQLN
ncbi:MAG: succinyl-diaminopimelate desuccinylase [Candidatus Anaerobiospirillum merdipullorum]|uniref:Succinyl-diaminopimelate desuccinylase n=1 Tax=Candidatus Anaerobiospirillum merdipullorum TaxID=2838450 RepID=A0A9E2KP94_9GAMM|nr:succinyl-diaminopimelate desuccinylase [Candidatus Anaerobiospirillum merdipullorum]